MRHAFVFLVCLAIAAIAYAGVGDTVRVTLKAGDPVSGKLVSENAREIKVETLVHNIPFVRTLKRSEISGIEVLGAEETPTPARPRDDARQPDPSDDEPDDIGDATSIRYLRIPVEGMIGLRSVDDPASTVTLEGVEAALTYARRRKIEHVVFSFDVNGGDVDVALSIVKAMRNLDDSLTTHAVIDRCQGAGIPIALACDHIWFTPSGRMATPGSNDATIDSAIAHEFRTIAKAMGYSGDAAAALIDRTLEVYAWTGDSGEAIVSNAPNPKGTGEQMDSRTTLLSVTAQTCVALGMGEPIRGDEAALGGALRIPSWEPLGQYGEKQLANATRDIIRAERDARALAEDIEQDIRKATSAISTINTTIKAAQNDDPSKYNYTIYEYGGTFTAESQEQWKNRTDRAIQEWQRAIAQIDAIAKKRRDIDSRLQKLDRTKPHDAFTADRAADRASIDEAIAELEEFGISLNDWRRRANENIERLRKDRNRDKP